MSLPVPPEPVKLFASVLAQDHELAQQACEDLAEKLGDIDFRSEPLPFDFTGYYTGEMGGSLFRHLISFRDLIAPDMLPDLKLYTNRLESLYMREDKTRQVNIDPGYIALHHVILATCKRFSHRPYLRDGIYADMTLLFRGKTFCPLEWTFPDYASPEMIRLLNSIRSVYHLQLRQLRRSRA